MDVHSLCNSLIPIPKGHVVVGVGSSVEKKNKGGSQMPTP